MADTKSGDKAAGAAGKANGATAAAPQAAPAGQAERKAGMTKMEAVKRALQALGSDAKPLQIQSYVSDAFNIEMTGAHVSDCKQKLLKRAALSSQAAPSTKPTPVGQSATTRPQKKAPASNVPAANKTTAPRQQVASASPAAALSRTNGGSKTAGGGSVLLEDVLTAKALLDRVGADNLRTLIDGLAK